MHYIKKIISSLIASTLIFTQIPFVKAETDITDIEKNQVENSMITLQNHIFQNSKDLVEKIISTNGIKSYEETGSGKLDFYFQYYTEYETQFKLNNFNKKSNSQDIELSGNFEGKIEDGKENNKDTTKFKSDFSLVNKDNKTYALLENFTGTTNNDYIKDQIEKISKIFGENKYIHLSDEENLKIAHVLLSLTPDDILNTVEGKMQKSFFTPYKKEGNKYFLIPTRHACETYFQFEATLNQFDNWYNPSECSDTVYMGFINRMKSSGELSITLGKTSDQLLYDNSNDAENIKMQINYNTDEIGMFLVDFSDKNNEENLSKISYFKINYLKNRHLNIFLKEDFHKSDFSFQSKLKNNNFHTIQSTISIPKVIKGNFILKNKKFGGKYYYFETDDEYNEKTKKWKTFIENTYFIQTSGTLNAQQNLESMNVKMIGVENKSKKTFSEGKLNYEKNNFSFFMKKQENTSHHEWKGNGSIKEDYFSLKGNYTVEDDYSGKLETEITAKLDTEIDLRENKNNFKFFGELYKEEFKLFEIDAEYKGQKYFKENIIIETPKNVSEINYLEIEEDTENIEDMGIEVETPIIEKEVNIMVIDDKRCKDCNTQATLEQLKALTALANATFTVKDFSDVGSEKIIKDAGITRLPAFIFEHNQIADYSFQQYLVPTENGKFYLEIGSSFDPYQKFSDRGFKILDSAKYETIKKSAHLYGDKNAEISWIEYFDIECQYCKMLHNNKTHEILLKKYGKSLNLHYQHYPIFNKEIPEVLECMVEQKGEQIIHPTLKTIFEKNITKKDEVIALVKGIDKKKIEACIKTGDHQKSIEESMNLGTETFGITGTPANILINNKTLEYVILPGAYPVSEFEKTIESLKSKK